MDWWLLLIPFGTAFSSWIVTKLFLKFLFHPKKRIAILGFKIQGILPAKQSEIAEQAGRLAAQQLVSSKIVEEKLTDPSHVHKIMPVIEENIDDFLRNKLKKQMPMIGMLIGEKTIGSMKKIFMDELEEMFPKLIKQFASNVISTVHINQLIKQKLNEVSLAEVENGFKKNFSRQLRLASVISGLTGLFIGLVIMLIIYFIK